MSEDSPQDGSQAPNRIAERHSIKRSAVSVTCTVYGDGEERDVFHSDLEDISNTGLRLSCGYALEKGARLELAFDIEGRTQFREGEVMWVRPLGGLFKLGVQFISRDNDLSSFELKEGTSFPCIYKIDTSHIGEGTVISVSDVGIVFMATEVLALGTMFEVEIDPWIDKAEGVFDISFANVYAVTDDWSIWDLHKVAKVAKAKVRKPGECYIQATFVSDKHT